MHHFHYRHGRLYAEDVSLTDMAAEVGTPFYCYSSAALVAYYDAFRDALAGLDTMICFAMKANSNQSVIRTLVEAGAGCDVVSEGELRRALAAGCPPQRIESVSIDMSPAFIKGVTRYLPEAQITFDNKAELGNRFL